MNLPLHNANRTMQLLNKTAIRGVPALYEQEDNGKETVAYLKFFLDSFTWFLTELDAETGEAFGKVFSHMTPDGELGAFSLPEIAGVSGRLGNAAERDRYFKPQPLSQCKP